MNDDAYLSTDQAQALADSIAASPSPHYGIVRAGAGWVAVDPRNTTNDFAVFKEQFADFHGQALTYSDGYAAATEGRPLSNCPVGPADSDGAQWRDGWLNGEMQRRANTGTFGATDEEKDRALRQVGSPVDPETGMAVRRRDPVEEILGDYLADQAAQHAPPVLAGDEALAYLVEKLKLPPGLAATMAGGVIIHASPALAASVDLLADFMRSTFDAMVPVITHVHAAFDDLTRALRADDQARAPQDRDRPGHRRKVLVCPVHGVQEHGLCVRCARRHPRDPGLRGRR